MRLALIRTLTAGAAVAALLVTTTAQTTNPRFGRWKLKSEAAAPQSNIMTYAPFGEKGMRVTIDAVSGSGEASQWGYTTNFDGKEEPMTGTRSSETAAVRMITDRIAEIVYRRNGQITQVLTNVLTLRRQHARDHLRPARRRR